MLSGQEIVEALVVAVLTDIPTSRLFVDLEGHMLETPVTENHVIHLIKTISKNYCKVRLHHIGKEKNQRLMKDVRMRKKMNKLVIFKNQ